jgi:hypothetical protein
MKYIDLGEIRKKKFCMNFVELIKDVRRFQISCPEIFKLLNYLEEIFVFSRYDTTLKCQ